MNKATSRSGELAELRAANTTLAQRLNALERLERANLPPGEAGWVLASSVPGRFSISPRTFERWLRRRDMGFPQPFKINGRRYFRDHELRAFQAKMEARGAA